MECDVCIDMSDGCDDGPTEFYNRSTVTARKEHRCEECRQKIAPGQKYEYVRAKWDGDFSTMKTCLMCAEIRDVFSCGSGIVHGCLWEEIDSAEVFQRLTTASPCFTQLSPAAKTFMLERWRKWKGLTK